MDVEVKCYGDVRGAVGDKSVSVSLEAASTTTVEDVLAALEANLDDDRELPDDLIVMRERAHVDRETAVAAGDVLSLTDPPMPEG